MKIPTSKIDLALAYLRTHGANVEYVGDFLSSREADHWLARLRDEVRFDPPERTRIRRPFSRGWVDIPRQQVAYGDAGTRYAFSGTSVAAHPWNAALEELTTRIAGPGPGRPNFVLINRYRSGADYMGWHADDERDLGPEPEILSLSLGAERDFQFRHKLAFSKGGRPGPRAELATVSLRLEHGSLLVMRHPTNRDFKHQLPRRGGNSPERVGERWNLTWRTVSRST